MTELREVPNSKKCVCVDHDWNIYSPENIMEPNHEPLENELFFLKWAILRLLLLIFQGEIDFDKVGKTSLEHTPWLILKDKLKHPQKITEMIFGSTEQQRMHVNSNGCCTVFATIETALVYPASLLLACQKKNTAPFASLSAKVCSQILFSHTYSIRQ